MIARHYHNRYHVDIDAIVAHIRAYEWVVDEAAADQIAAAEAIPQKVTIDEAADVRAANEGAAEKAAVKSSDVSAANEAAAAQMSAAEDIT